MSQSGKAEVRPRRPLTERQQGFLRLIESLWTDDGPPTVRQLCAAAGFESTNAVTDHLRSLERRGWLQLRGGRKGGQRAVGRSGIARLTNPLTWPWFNLTLQGESANYLISIQAPSWALAAVWAREDWHGIGAPDSIKGVLIDFSERTSPEFEQWVELSHDAQ
jgi:SOS-response transcriptional repressor LexA